MAKTIVDEEQSNLFRTNLWQQFSRMCEVREPQFSSDVHFLG